MRTNQRATREAFSRFATRTVSALAVSLAVGAAAAAKPVSVTAANDPAEASFFSLDFGELGGVASGHIASTDIEFEVDADRGTARFVRYYQEVEPLILPGGFSTGNLTIEIVEGSSTGSFDQLTGEFQTEEFYEIHFEGDLSAFGLESPVFLPSASSGIVTLGTDTGGRIALDWLGEGELANPFDPDNPIEFTYTCTVRAAFDPDPVTLVRLTLIPEVLKLELSRRTEKRLTKRLFHALDQLKRGLDRDAARTLKAFTGYVERLPRRDITKTEAHVLINAANAIIAILR